MAGHGHQDGQAKETSVVLSVGTSGVLVVKGPGATRGREGGRGIVTEKSVPVVLCREG